MVFLFDHSTKFFELLDGLWAPRRPRKRADLGRKWNRLRKSIFGYLEEFKSEFAGLTFGTGMESPIAAARNLNADVL